jgi:DNA-binding beta-propeller fold protein YncE
MPIVPVAPPVAVHSYGGFDYVAVDAPRHRVYAAHTASRRLLIVDSSTGEELGQVEVGPVHGVAVDPATGDVFTGDGTDDNVMKVDPVAQKVVGEADVSGPVDAIAYDPSTRRIYADEDGGTVVYAIDATTMKPIDSVPLPGHGEEYLAVDPETHAVYQNVPDLAEFVEIDPQTLRVSKVVKTPMLVKNHPLQYDSTLHEVVVGGKNGVMAAYSPEGTLLGLATFPSGVDQCSLDRKTHVIACAGKGIVSALQLHQGGAPTLIATTTVGGDAHTIGVDDETGMAWTALTEQDRDSVQALRLP